MNSSTLNRKKLFLLQYIPVKRRFWILLGILLLAGSGLHLLNKTAAQPATDPAVTDVTISTVAGGGFGSNVQARLAPMVQPTAVALDPQGRGFYVVDEVNGTSLLRFVNTSPSSVTISGVTVLPNHINLISGGGAQSNDGTSLRDADLALITGLAIEPSGNLLYVTIPAVFSVRAINVGTQAVSAFGKNIAPGTITSVASVAPSVAVGLRSPAIHPATGELYFISDRIVQKVDSAGNVSNVAGGGNPNPGNGDGGSATEARLIAPMGLAFDSNNNLLIAEGGDVRATSGAVRRVDSSNLISSLASGLEFPTAISSGPNGDAFVALGNAQQILRITSGGSISVVAGNANKTACDNAANPSCGDGGPSTQANLNIPDSTANTSLTMAVDARGLFLPDFRFKRVRFVNLSGGQVNIAGTAVAPQTINTVVGSGLASPYDNTDAVSAELFAPTGVVADASGNLYIADTGNNRLRFVNRTSSPITLFAGTASQLTAQPGHIVSLNKNVGDEIVDDRIATAFFAAPQGLAITANGVLIVDSQDGSLIKIPPTSISGRRSGVIRFLNTSGSNVTFYPSGGDAAVVIPPGQIKDVAGVRTPLNPQSLGDGMKANQVAFFPTDVAVDQAGNLYIADQGNNRIRRVDAASGVVGTIFGDGTPATLNGATGIAFDNSGRLHIADTRNNRILRQNAPGDGSFSVIADASRSINRPRDLVVDGTGKIFLTNSLSHQVFDLEAPSNGLGNTSVVAGNGTVGFSGDGGPGSIARLSLPNPGTAQNDIQLTTNIAIMPNGDLVFTDTNNNRIRLLRRSSAANPVASVSAASFLGNELAVESIVAAFGQRMATGTEVATSIPLPTMLQGTEVRIVDSAGTERPAPLFFVSAGQVNYQVPPGSVTGPATIAVISGDGSLSTGTLNIASVAPGLFSANANGQGVAAAVVLRVTANNAQTFEPVSRFDAGQNRFVPVDIDLGPPTDQVFFVGFGTGFRFRSSLAAVSSTIGGAPSEVLFAGGVQGFVGLDQTNIRIPRSLIGRGLVNVVMTVDGKTTNMVTLQIK